MSNRQGHRWANFGLRLLGLLLIVLILVAGISSSERTSSAGSENRSSAIRVTSTARNSSEAADLDAGRRLYNIYCWFCHGTEGHGDGRVAQFFTVKPRNFTLAQYKIRSTPLGALPTDEDLFRTISRGVPGTYMPDWHTLSERERWQLVSYIKHFSDRFRTVGAPLVAATTDPLTDGTAVDRGRQIFERVKCWLCHGKEGLGDGPITTALVRQWGFPYDARNLRDGASYKGGSTAEDIFRTIANGFNGTPMGSHEELLNDEDRWCVAHYVASLADREVSRDTLPEPGISWQRGRWVFFGKGRCILCHKVEGIGAGERGPDLSEIGIVAATRRKERNQSAVEYIFESIVKPAEFLVPDYMEQMPKINEEAIFLEGNEIRSLVVYLASQGKGAKPDRSQLASLPEPPAPEPTSSVLPELTGDPVHGWEVYNSEKANCFKCHTIHQHGFTVGPDLTNLAAFQSSRQILESLLEPNKVITFGYKQVMVATDDGRIFSGLVTKEDPGEIHLVDDQGNVKVIAQDEIDEIAHSKISNMPTGITAQLDEQARADLLAFLLDQQPVLESTFRMPPPSSFVNPLGRPKNGPPLINVTHKVGLTWITRWLKNPKDHDPNAFMPVLELTDEEIEAIVAYLSAIADEEFPRYEWEPYFSKSFDDLTSEEFDALDDQVMKGKTLWSESRCSICHRVGERGGVAVHAPALTNAAMKLRRDWVVYWLADPRYYFADSQMPHFRFTLEERKSLAAYLLRGDDTGGLDVEIAPDDQSFSSAPPVDLIRRGREVIERTRCVVCHDIPGIRDSLAVSLEQVQPRNDFELLVRDARCLTCHSIEGQGATFAPDLTTAGSRLRREWLEAFIHEPDIIRPLLKQMPKLRLTEAEAHTVSDYVKRHLLDPRIDADFLADYQPVPDDIEAGKQIYEAKGCKACHQIGLTGGAIGPTLTLVVDRLEPGYIYEYLKDPQRFKADVVEPNYGLTNGEALALTKFLLSLKPEDTGDK